jgi:hypothetical protein
MRSLRSPLLATLANSVVPSYRRTVVPSYCRTVILSNGTRQPVTSWDSWKKLAKDERLIIGDDLKTTHYGWPLGMPLIRKISGRSVSEIIGDPDDRKLKSSTTLFAHIAGPHSVFVRVLDKYFQGDQDLRTLHLLAKPK